MPRRLRPLGGATTTRAARTPAKGALSSQELLENLAGGPGHSENILGAFDYGDLRSTLRNTTNPGDHDTIMFADVNRVRGELGPDGDEARVLYQTRGRALAEGSEAPLRVPRARMTLDEDNGDLVVRMVEGDSTAHVYANYLHAKGMATSRIPIRISPGESRGAGGITEYLGSFSNVSGMVRVGDSRVPFDKAGLPEGVVRSIGSRLNPDKFSEGLTETVLNRIPANTRQPQLQEVRFANEATAIIRGNQEAPEVALAQIAKLSGMPDDLKTVAARIGKTMEAMQADGFVFGASVPTPYHRGARLNRGAYQNETTRGLNTFDPVSLESYIELRHPRGFDPKGATAEVIVHEYVHATTQAAVYFAKSKNAPAHIKEAVAELEDILKLARAEFIKSTKGTGNLATGTEMFELNRTNAFADVDELLAWGLTNPQMQSYLRGLAAPGTDQTVWQRMVQAIAKILGLDAPQGSALERVLTRADELLEFGESGGLTRGLQQDLDDAFSGF